MSNIISRNIDQHRADSDKSCPQSISIHLLYYINLHYCYYLDNSHICSNKKNLLYLDYTLENSMLLILVLRNTMIHKHNKNNKYDFTNSIQILEFCHMLICSHNLFYNSFLYKWYQINITYYFHSLKDKCMYIYCKYMQ